jgi:hypothetical protein
MKTITKFIYFGFASLALGCLTLSPTAQAINPPPSGGYPGANTAEGQAALLSLTDGIFNTAVGYSSLRSAMHGSFNTAVGAAALFANTGNENTAIGIGALYSNTADFNTAVGSFALFNNTTGFSNTANGQEALQNVSFRVHRALRLTTPFLP